MQIFGFAGFSGSGKTTLLEKLIPVLVAKGLKVSLIKHAHHDFDIDQPGKDSYRHRAAGCGEVLISSAKRYALIHELRGEPEPSLDDLLRRLSPCDLVLVEGFKRDPFSKMIPKLEVHRGETGKPLLFPDDPHIVALATNQALQTSVPQFALDDVVSIAGFILSHLNLKGT